MSLDEASQGFLAALAEARSIPIHESTPAIARMSGPAFARMSGPGPQVERVEEHELSGHGAGSHVDNSHDDSTHEGSTTSFRVRVLRPTGAPQGIIVYYHGGGWVIGDIDLQYDAVGRRLAVDTGCTVVMVNYRKAPEFPFPTPLLDSYTALQWVAENRERLGAGPVPLIVAGDSAGANIAAVMTHWARDHDARTDLPGAHGPHIDFQVLVYPVTDCDFTRPSYTAPENQLLLSANTMVWFWNHYCADPQARTNPDASPLRRDDLSGLPPAFICLAEFDPLHDEGRAYADALAAAGTPVECVTATGQMHAFFQMINVLPGFDAAMAQIADRIRTITQASGSLAQTDHDGTDEHHGNDAVLAAAAREDITP